MTTSLTKYPKYEDHQRAWEELAKGIASLKNKVREIEEGSIPANSKPGQLTIIGTGIETIGVSVGDQRLLEEADKVLYCVADPATIVWLKRIRPDALDLYVLYGDDKVRYTTYMQMTEAQLYWVRQGLNVVVVFYGHPGIFVLSTHRAIKLARREGHKSTMKAGVCALDTLCADLGVDPCHPGLQTHEATDCLTRQRKLDTSLHVILWQVGLIGELGYRRHGYLNNNFSYFINWLESRYGSDYEITHYIGSRYPTIDPLIEIYKLKELHDPEIQTRITGLSTFYIPPRDVVPSDYQTVKDLGIISEGQKLVTPTSPLREIGLYGPREMKAFDAFANFRIPPSYKWQPETEASNFLTELRFDTKLQDLYRRDPVAALADERFSGLSDKERQLLVSRDSGAIQIAAKGAYVRSTETEKTLNQLLTNKRSATDLLKRIVSLPKLKAREQFNQWLADRGLTIDWASLHSSIDFINRNNLYPWTGVYIESDQEFVITLIGNNTSSKSILYVNDKRIRHFIFENGTLKWKANSRLPFSGFLRFDVDRTAKRGIVGKIWSAEEKVPSKNNFVACEIDPKRKKLVGQSGQFYKCSELGEIYGHYAVRTNGRFVKDVNDFVISESGLQINQQQITDFSFEQGKLRWHGGTKECFSGEVQLLCDPVINSVEFFGHSFSAEEPGEFKCYGSILMKDMPKYTGPSIPEWAQKHLVQIAYSNSDKGGLLLWHKWEKSSYTSMVVNRFVSNLT